jgi:hypothetical protein
MPFYLTHQQGDYAHIPELPDYYFEAEQDNHNQMPELQVCLAEAIYDIASILAEPTALPDHELVRLRDQVVGNLERAWEITGNSKEQLAAMMSQISQVAAKRGK